MVHPPQNGIALVWTHSHLELWPVACSASFSFSAYVVCFWSSHPRSSSSPACKHARKPRMPSELLTPTIRVYSTKIRPSSCLKFSERSAPPIEVATGTETMLLIDSPTHAEGAMGPFYFWSPLPPSRIVHATAGTIKRSEWQSFCLLSVPGPKSDCPDPSVQSSLHRFAEQKSLRRCGCAQHALRYGVFTWFQHRSSTHVGVFDHRCQAWSDCVGRPRREQMEVRTDSSLC